ncbi:hypothetical protein SUDANB105_01855 [Streptomyces sp. enrichment culture]
MGTTLGAVQFSQGFHITNQEGVPITLASVSGGSFEGALPPITPGPLGPPVFPEPRNASRPAFRRCRAWRFQDVRTPVRGLRRSGRALARMAQG